MERLKIDGKWGIIKGLLKVQFENLTNEDLDYEEGKEKDLLERLSLKTGLTQEQLIKEINKF